MRPEKTLAFDRAELAARALANALVAARTGGAPGLESALRLYALLGREIMGLQRPGDPEGRVVGRIGPEDPPAPIVPPAGPGSAPA